MKNPLLGLTICLIIAIVIICVLWYDISRPDYIEGTILDKYVDFEGKDEFKFVIMDGNGTAQICAVTAEQYYSYEIGDWFEGEVIYADDPDSGWD